MFDAEMLLIVCFEHGFNYHTSFLTAQIQLLIFNVVKRIMNKCKCIFDYVLNSVFKCLKQAVFSFLWLYNIYNFLLLKAYDYLRLCHF